MNSSGDAAESIVRMSLQGIEVAARITGSGAKNVGAFLYAVAKDKQQTKGKTNLTNMLKSGKELKVFSVKEEDLKKFTQEAKRYGVLFSALIDKRHKSNDGMVDIMVRAEDASKINRIVNRFNLSTVDTASIKSEIIKNKEKTQKEKGVKERSAEEKLVDEILSEPIDKENNEISNPHVAKTEKSPQSEPILKNKNKSDQGTKSDKPSVREQIKNIRKERQEKTDLGKFEVSKQKTKNNRNTKHQKHFAKKKIKKERGAK